MQENVSSYWCYIRNKGMFDYEIKMAIPDVMKL